MVSNISSLKAHHLPLLYQNPESLLFFFWWWRELCFSDFFYSLFSCRTLNVLFFFHFPFNTQLPKAVSHFSLAFYFFPRSHAFWRLVLQIVHTFKLLPCTLCSGLRGHLKYFHTWGELILFFNDFRSTLGPWLALLFPTVFTFFPACPCSLQKFVI